MRLLAGTEPTPQPAARSHIAKKKVFLNDLLKVKLNEAKYKIPDWGINVPWTGHNPICHGIYIGLSMVHVNLLETTMEWT